MKLVKYAGYLMFAAVMVAGLGACSKKKNGSVAATPASVCSMNQYGQYVNAQGVACSPTANQCVMGANGQYVNQYGQPCSQYSQCTMNAYGQYVNQLGQQCSPGYPSQYATGQQYGCNQWTLQYGIQYVPVYLQGGLQCVRIDLLQPYAQGTYYQDYGYDYYYAYPPYSGSGCSTQVNFGGSWGNVGICF